MIARSPTRYVVVLDLPVTFSMKALIGGHSFPYRWNPEHRRGSACCRATAARTTSIWCALSTPAYVFHVANAFDQRPTARW